MKNRIGIVVLVLLCLGLGIALITTNRDASRRQADDAEQISTLSNKVTTTTGHHLNSSGGAENERCEALDSLERGGCTPRREYPPHAANDERLERLSEVGSAIECAVKRHRQIVGGGHQLQRALDVDATALSERAKDDAVRTELACDIDVAPHHVELPVGVDETAAAGTNDDEDRNGDACFHRGDHAGAWRGASVAEARAQFETAGSAPCGGERGIDRIDARFHQAACHLKSRINRQRPAARCSRRRAPGYSCHCSAQIRFPERG